MRCEFACGWPNPPSSSAGFKKKEVPRDSLDGAKSKNSTLICIVENDERFFYSTDAKNAKIGLK
jgi:hypothetical protein